MNDDSVHLLHFLLEEPTNVLIYFYILVLAELLYLLMCELVCSRTFAA